MLKLPAFWGILAVFLSAGLLVGASGAAHPVAPLLDTPTATGTAALATFTATGTPTSIAIPPTSMPETGTATSTPTVTAVTSPSITVTATATPPVCDGPAWHLVTNGFYDIAAIGPNDAWAVAGTIYHWDGTAWHESPHPTPNPSLTPDPSATPSVDYSYFNYVAAGAPNSVWAFGADSSHFWVEHWDGVRWSQPARYQFPTNTAPAAHFWAFGSVAAVGANDAYVIITEGSFPNFFSYVIHLTATMFTASARQQPLSYGSALSALSGASPDDLWGVGYSQSHDDVQDTYIAYVGAVQPFSGVYPNIGGLSGIVAIHYNDIWAVGGGGILHWDGAAWTQVPSPDGAGSVAGRTSNDVWAVGRVVQHWDGTAWRVVLHPETGARKVMVSPGGDVWTLGQHTYHYTAVPTFSDVPAVGVFAPAIESLRCRGILSGYTCGGAGEPCDVYSRPYFRPSSGISRGQLLKLVAGTAGWVGDPTTVTFADVPPGSPFYTVVEAGAAHGLVGGYACSSAPSEPCDAQRRPYFRPGNALSRGQLAQVLTAARGYPVPPPGAVRFADVAAGAPFYDAIAAVAAQGLVSGYTCGSRPSEPCDAERRPYYRPAEGATHGQVSKVVSRAYGGP